MGETVIHEIVPHADTVIILKNPCIEFAEWGQPPPSTTEEIAEAYLQLALKRRREYLVKKGLATDEKKPVTAHYFVIRRRQTKLK